MFVCVMVSVRVCTCSLEEKKKEEPKEEKIERVRDNFMDRFMKVE